MISTTELLGTDSVAGSRPIINDNVSILTNEINLIENYFDPNSAILDNIASMTTNNLVVGISAARLTITPSTFTVSSDVNLNGNLFLNGNLVHNNILSTTIETSSTIGSPTSAPEYSTYRVTNTSTVTPVVIDLYAGEIGQEITFVYDSSNTGDININPAGSTEIMGASSLTLNAVGQSVVLKCISNALGNTEWYIISGYAYTVNS